MIFLVFVHGYTLESKLKTASDLIGEPMNFTSFFEMLVVNSFLRFRIPLLMIISGYLMAKSTHDSHISLIRSRFKSLIVPFFLISIISIIFVFLLETLIYPNSTTAIWDTRVDLLGTKGLLVRIFVNPFAYQLWYIKFLFLLVLLFPVLKFLANRIPKLFLIVLFLMWVFGEESSLLIHAKFSIFFVIGIFLFDKKIDILNKPKWFRTSHFLILFILVGLFKTYISFKGVEIMGAKAVLANSILLDLNILTGILLSWFGINTILYKIENIKWYTRATGYGFFIYAFHAPLINLLNSPSLVLTRDLFANRLLVFLFLPIVVIAFCILLHEFVKTLFPQFFRLLTGARWNEQNAPLLLVYDNTTTNSSYKIINKELAIRYALFAHQLTD